MASPFNFTDTWPSSDMSKADISADSAKVSKVPRSRQLILAYCWAHARRKFLDVHKATKSDKAYQVFTLINDI